MKDHNIVRKLLDGFLRGNKIISTWNQGPNLAQLAYGNCQRYTENAEDIVVVTATFLFVGLRTVTRASIDESVFATTRVHFHYSVTRMVLYYRPCKEAFM